MASPCTANLTSWTDTVSSGVLLKALHFSQMRTAIINEVTRRGKTALTWTYGVPSAGTQINANIWDEYYTKIQYIRTSYNVNPAEGAFSWTYTTAGAGVSILSARLLELRAKINDLENDCTCNCDYCTCNCNYCTCLCNYACTCLCNYACTCNCNYACTCLCNYACTCNCNYACTCNCNYGCTCNCNYSGTGGPTASWGSCAGHTVGGTCISHTVTPCTGHTATPCTGHTATPCTGHTATPCTGHTNVP